MAEGLSRGAYIGMRALRREDARLLAGRGRFVGAVRLPGMLHAVVVRSRIAHGRLVRCDVGSAGAVDGVVEVITPSSAPGIRLRCVSLAPGQRETSYPVLDEVVRYVGQPVAVVVARTAAAALDAAGLIDLRFDELPAVITLADAPAANVVTDFELGDSAADCAEAIASAHHVVEMTFRFGRASPYPLEPRGIVASFTDGELTIWTSTQAPHHVRDHAADALGLGHGRVRVISHDTGG